MTKGKCFLRAFLRVWNRIRGLDVDAFVSLVDDEVDFVLADLVFPSCAGLKLDYADIDRVPAAKQLVVDDVFHEVCRFVLPEVHAGVAESGIGGVVFTWRFKVPPSLYIVPLRLADKKGVFEEAEYLPMVV